MKLALCGYPPLALQLQKDLKGKDVEFKFFISDFVTARQREEVFTANIPLINFFEFRRLVNTGELDGLIIAEDARNSFTKMVVRLCKLYEIPQVGVTILRRFNPLSPIYWLDPNKACVATLNTNLIDGCNLNCKGCTHFAKLFKQDEIYPLEMFKRDVRRLSEIADVCSFALLGGEPLLIGNLDKYIRIARQYFPKTSIRLVTNGLLIPKMSQAVIDALIDTKTVVGVSIYPPTRKIFNEIKTILDSNKIFYSVSKPIEKFGVFLTLHGDNNPEKSRKFCAGNDTCRFLREGKIYKCPVDALSYRFTEKFGIEGYPKSTGVDIYAQNFSSLLDMLDDNIEMCNWCSDKKTKLIAWEPVSNPKLEDWLANPDELKNFQ